MSLGLAMKKTWGLKDRGRAFGMHASLSILKGLGLMPRAESHKREEDWASTMPAVHVM